MESYMNSQERTVNCAAGSQEAYIEETVPNDGSGQNLHIHSI